MPLNQIGATQHDYATGTDFTITNYLAGYCDVVKQSTGTQMSQFEHDAATGLMGEWKPDRIWFDGLVYVDAVDTGWIPSVSEDWTIENIIDIVPTDTYQFNGLYEATTKAMRFGVRHNGKIDFAFGSISIVSPLAYSGYTHVMCMYVSGVIKLYIDGVQAISAPATADQTSLSFFISNRSGGASYPFTSEQSFFKIWQGDEYAKFDPAKSYAKAQALITKWEAE